MNSENNGWLCRHCNTLIDNDLAKCPKCGAERPERVESQESEEVVVVESNTQNIEPKKSKYLFRESVLINAADILLILGIFGSFAALIAPIFLDETSKSITIGSIVSALAILFASLITWALFRNIAEISRMLRRREEKELND